MTIQTCLNYRRYIFYYFIIIIYKLVNENFPFPIIDCCITNPSKIQWIKTMAMYIFACKSAIWAGQWGLLFSSSLGMNQGVMKVGNWIHLRIFSLTFWVVDVHFKVRYQLELYLNFLKVRWWVLRVNIPRKSKMETVLPLWQNLLVVKICIYHDPEILLIGVGPT